MSSLVELGNPKAGKKPGKTPDWSDFIWLVYAIFFFIEPVSRHSRPYWLQFSAFFGVFLALYTGLVFARRRWQSYLLLVGMGVLGIIYCPLNPGTWGVFVYIAAFIPFITESLAISLGTIAVCCGILITEGILLHITPWAWGFGALFTIIVGGTNLFHAQRMRANSKLQMAHEEIEHLAKLAERERIARDLHDVLGHTLSVVVLKSELAGKLMDRDPARARREIGEVEHIARKALTDVREAIRGYRAEGLAAEIDHAHRTLDAAGVTLECGDKPPQLPPAAETVLSLIVREAVTNIVRHAQASHCRLEIEASGEGTALVVEDDGRGGIRQEGNGLRGMRERVEALGGRFRIESSQGTRLVIQIPPQTPAQA
ncbi:MAG TPA: sensor histidine kinase [Acidobacteriaceae bacterium]|jgi:two-component system sensor histidine kinase DesK|nr:sensor histidine kinase [Acidobacteriaceae bacterium]